MTTGSGFGQWRAAGAMIALGTAIAFTPMAVAQEILTSPAAISSCLCQEQSVAALSGEVANGHRAYEDRRRELDDLNAQVEQGRGRVDVNNQTAVDAYKQLLDRRDAAQARFSDEVSPNYAALVARYNQAVAGFNGACSGKSYEMTVLAQVRGNLICPKQ